MDILNSESNPLHVLEDEFIYKTIEDSIRTTLVISNPDSLKKFTMEKIKNTLKSELNKRIENSIMNKKKQ